MKKKTAKIKPGLTKYLLVLPLFLLSFCQSEFEEPQGASENKLTIDAKVLSLMKSAIQSDSDQVLTQNKSDLSKGTATEDTGQCTNFLYPMTFQVYSGDDPIPETKEINSDEELIAFIEAFTFENTAGVFTPNYEMFIYFPIILLDTDGYETVLNDLTELEGTLQMAVEACDSFNEGLDDTFGDGSGDGSTGGSDDSSADSPVDGSNDQSGDGSDDTSSEESGDGSDSGSSDGSDDSSGDDSNDGSNDGSNDQSGDGSDDTSGDGSNDGSNEGSDDGSDDSSGNDSNDGSDDGSDNDSFEESNENDDGYKYCDKNNKKVYICHKGKTICVSVNAIWGHMYHHEEDFLGTCDD